MRTAWWILCLALPAIALPQFDQAVFDRSESWSGTLQNKVINERLTCGWSGNWFWYRKQSSLVTHQYYKLSTSQRKPLLAFDHEKVANAAKTHLGIEVKPDSLPISSIKFQGMNTILSFPEGALRVDASGQKVEKASAEDFAGLKAYSPIDVTSSEGSGEQTSIQFVNQSKVKLRISWLPEDEPPREYKVLEPGEAWSIRTWEGHYWLVSRMDGTKLAVYKPEDSGTAFLKDVQVPAAPRDDSEPGFSPDRKHRVLIEQNKVYLINVATQEKKLVAGDGSGDFVYRGPLMWSKTGSYYTFFKVVPEERRPLNIVHTSPTDQLQPRLRTQQYLKPGDRVELPIPVMGDTSGAIKEVQMTEYSNPFNLMDETWFEGDRFRFRYNERGHQRMVLLEATWNQPKPRVVFEEVAKTFIDWTRKAYYMPLNEGREALWMSERSGYNHLYLVNLDNGKAKPITQGNWVVRDVRGVDANTSKMNIRFSGMDADQDPYNVHFGQVDYRTGELTRWTRGNGTHVLRQPGPNSETYLATYSRPDMPPVHELRERATGALIAEIARADAAPLLKEGFRLPIPMVAKGRDGKTDIWGNVYLPSNFDPKKKYPVIEDIYAGPHDSHVPKDFHISTFSQRVAELGYIVVKIDGMGTSNRSKAFHDVCWKNIADAGFPDRKLWIQAAAKRVPQMDLGRVGIFGTSAGGQNALHALELHGDFYKAAVADCGCYDNRMDKIWWNEQWMGWPIGKHYEEQSGSTLANRVTGKLMLMLGEIDTNVDPASTYQVVNALIKANKTFDLVVMPNVGHGALGTRYARMRMAKFFAEALQ